MSALDAHEQTVYDTLRSLGVAYEVRRHAPAHTMTDCLALGLAPDVAYCKNLFLCNRQKTNYYLLVMPGGKNLQTKELSPQIPSSRLSFASGEDMEKYLNVTPGSATIMGLIFDPENRVQLLIDEDVLGEEYFACHPCVNTSSIRLKTEDVLGKFLKAVHHDYIPVKLSR